MTQNLKADSCDVMNGMCIKIFWHARNTMTQNNLGQNKRKVIYVILISDFTIKINAKLSSK